MIVRQSFVTSEAHIVLGEPIRCECGSEDVLAISNSPRDDITIGWCRKHWPCLKGNQTELEL